jgi:hypothetical protein
MAQKESEHKEELAKLQGQLAAIEAERKSREARALKKSALAKALKTTEDKIPDDMVGFIGGDDAEAIKNNAVLFAKLLPSIKTTDGGGNPPDGANAGKPPRQSAIDQLERNAKYEAEMLAARDSLFGKG